MQKARYFFLILLLTSCTSYPESIEDVLRQAGGNRKEFEKALKHYSNIPADSLKLRAAEFLIINMPGKYSEYYDVPWNDVATVFLRWTSSLDKQLVLDTYKMGEPVRKDDVTHVTAEYLIKNIELAFKVWEEMPWGKDIPFDVFCEEILPYRVSTEPLENWREKALASFAELYESFKKDTAISSVEACIKVNDKLPRFRIDRDFPAMNYTQLMATARGSCESMSSLAVFVMRALGIPAVVDYTIQWPDRLIGHSWNSVRDSKGNYISFMGTETNPGGKPHQGITSVNYKVFRHTFGRQPNINAREIDIPPSFRDQCMKDVSSEYSGFTDVEIPALFQPENPAEYAYLAVPYNNSWNPASWGKIEQKKIQFSSIAKNLLYLPVYYCNHIQIPANFPFWVDNYGNCHILQHDSLVQNMEFIGIAQETKYIDRMLHGRFEGANRSDFSDATLLYAIDEVHGMFFHSADVRHTSKFRYVRYLSPEYGRGNVAELEFYDKNGDKVSGTVIGTPGDVETSCDKVFDGDFYTFFDVNYPDNVWVGLDLGKPSAIGKIRFFPRTGGNSIYDGHTYVLNCWNGRDWYPADKQVATGHLLHCNAPPNSLFYLQNVTMNKTGRYFCMQDGVQKWL